MSYLDRYKKGGERQDATKKAKGYAYLSKKYSHDMTVRIDAIKKILSTNPKQKGVEKFIVEFTPTKVRKTTQKGKDVQDPVVVGEAFNYMFKLTHPGNDMAEDAAMNEMIRILAAAAGKTEDELLRSLLTTEAGEKCLIDDLLEDDGAACVGREVNIVSLEPKDGYANLEWSAVAA